MEPQFRRAFLEAIDQASIESRPTAREALTLSKSTAGPSAPSFTGDALPARLEDDAALFGFAALGFAIKLLHAR